VARGVVSRESAEAFEQVYDEHVWNVYGFFGYRLASREEAEDLTQLTFERALRAWNRFDSGRASVRTWLLAIAHNLLVDHYRSKASVRQERLPEGEAADGILGLAELPDDRLGLSPELEAALHELDGRERELLALRFGGDLTGPEIAELTGLTLANVQQILSRALRKLRANLESAASARPTEPTGAAG
jgi:RNA polymerase sigma factor (sigma-70 family)